MITWPLSLSTVSPWTASKTWMRCDLAPGEEPSMTGPDSGRLCVDCCNKNVTLLSNKVVGVRALWHKTKKHTWLPHVLYSWGHWVSKITTKKLCWVSSISGTQTWTKLTYHHIIHTYMYVGTILAILAILMYVHHHRQHLNQHWQFVNI
jgi:hypothetical protein